MVEGPGCKLKGERLKASVLGQQILTVLGNVVKSKSKKGDNSSSKYLLLKGLRIQDVKTLGKELFILLENDFCIRIHFLMDGFVRYNMQVSDPDESSSKSKEEIQATLEFELSKDVVSFFQCSTDIRSSKDSLARWENMITLDICWKMFDFPRAVNTIMDGQHQERMVCDVIMDQSILPGVGNIIKNEACFNASINPLTKIKDLTKDHINHLVKMLRDFSLIFYDCRKTGKALSKHYKMYRFSECKECEGKVTKCHPGEYKRGTYFCSKCQNNDINSGASKNSLLGWVRKSCRSDEWPCTFCTLLNKPGSLKCIACGNVNSSIQTHKRKLEDEDSYDRYDVKKPKIEERSPLTTVKTQRSQGGNTFTFKSFRTVNKDSTTSTSSPAFTKTITELCKEHKRPCVKKTVSKEGPNKLRLFWSCSLPKNKSCNHFSWADLHHPKCKHGHITLLREVYKLNENNGRKFFVCPKPKGSKDQCDFFQWDENETLK